MYNILYLLFISLEIAAVLQAEEDGLIEQSEPQTSQSTTIHNE